MIGKVLREIRVKNNLKQTELAKKVGFAKNTISQYELGKRKVEFDKVEKIARACGYRIIFFNYTKNIITINILEEIK